MSEALVVNGNAFSLNPPIVNPNIKRQKKQVMSKLKEKLEQAKLNLIYTELDELAIPYDKNCSTVKELTTSLKKSLNPVDFNKYETIAKKVDSSLTGMVDSLEKGSTNAFTKVMTSDLAKTIGKVLGISLAGRTALLLAPTVGTKALVGLGLGAYSLYRVIKNRKEIIKANEENELNLILKDLEATKEGDKYTDTRFNEEAQVVIRDFLKSSGVTFEDTGYRSLREAIYSLPADKKRSLCDLLNTKLGKGIAVEERVKKAKKKLNVAASTAANIGAGAGVGVRLANTVNALDPALGAGVLNGTVLGAWIESQVDKPWYSALAGSLGLFGTEVVAHIPYIGGVAQKFFAAENLAACCALGATGGLVVSGALTAASIAKNICGHVKNNKEIKKFIELDSSKYRNDDIKELTKIKKNMESSTTEVEDVVVDIVIGYLKDEGITLEGIPKNIEQLNHYVNRLDKDKKKKAKNIIERITNEINNDPSFVGGLKRAGKISIGLFTAGLAAMSVYDILKSGTFLPELSRKLFPENNIYNPVPIPEAVDKPLDLDKASDSIIYNSNKGRYDEFASEEYLTEQNGDYYMDYGYEFGVDNPGLAGYGAQQQLQDYGMTMNLWDNIKRLFGWEPEHPKVPDVEKIAEKLRELSPKKLYGFYRMFSTIPKPEENDELYNAVEHILASNSFMEKASEYINGFEKTQKIHDIINSVTNKVATGAIPLATGLEMLGFIEKQKTNDKFAIQEEETHTMKM